MDAVEELRWHRDSRRLSAEEFERRANRARHASSRADLAILFADLPRHSTVAPGTAYADRVARARRQRYLAGRAVGLSFVVAVVLFAAVGTSSQRWSWVWVFFLLPVVTALMRLRDLRAKPARAGQNG